MSVRGRTGGCETGGGLDFALRSWQSLEPALAENPGLLRAVLDSFGFRLYKPRSSAASWGVG